MNDTPNRTAGCAAAALASVTLLGWLALNYMRELGRAYGNGGPTPDSTSIIVGLVTLLSVGGLIASFVLPRLRWLAMAPMALVLLGEAAMFASSAQRSDARRTEDARLAAAIDEHVAPLEQAYALPREPGNHHFLFVDEETHFLMHIEQGPRAVDAYCMGRVVGETLTVREEPPAEGRTPAVAAFADEAGETPLDHFTVVYEPDMLTEGCRPERYSFLPR